ncbi:MAG: HAMP domain-containing histidine kinase [Bdellovibrionales bacterium]|nr:HAMP domain-containing histidine kinase [Bdellovibrionales bacterium]
MKTIGAKLSITVWLIAGCTFYFSASAYHNFKELHRLQDDLHVSLFLRGYAQQLETKKTNLDTLEYLKKLRRTIPQVERKNHLSNLIQALNTNNPQLKSLRFKELEEGESKYFDDAKVYVIYYQREFAKYILASVLTPLLGLVFFSIYLRRSIVKPLQKLSQRMMDFLVDRYTFKLSTPQNNEIGDLQRTFNSLAERVVNNMDELKSLDRAKSEFVSIASHELRTPLTSIKGSLGLLSSGIMGELNGDSLGLVRIAEQETDRLVRLINNLLDLAKMESRQFKLQKDWMSVQGLSESILEGLLGFAQQAKVHLHIQRPSEDIEANLDRDRIQQVVTNLISNAIKYSPKNDTVVLSYYINAEKKLEIAITDRGPGIQPKDQQLIFEKFRQGTASEHQLVKGTGLGLAISKALVEEHGGELSLRSTPGQGSTFFFTLPEWRNSVQSSTDSFPFGAAA